MTRKEDHHTDHSTEDSSRPDAQGGHCGDEGDTCQLMTEDSEGETEEDCCCC